MSREIPSTRRSGGVASAGQSLMPAVPPRSVAPAPIELLHSLGRVARGLSALFWGLPLALVVNVQTAATGWFAVLGFVPPVLANGLVLYGLLQLGHFQKQERVWRQALDRAQVLAVIAVGLAPFLHWFHRMPHHLHFQVAVAVLAVAALLLLFQLNRVMQRLAAMLPDETLRLDTRLFTTVNLGALTAIPALAALAAVAVRLGWSPRLSPGASTLVDLALLAGLVLLVLLPLALTMTLLWKTKETILAGIFSHGA